jgi:dolichol kinase
MILKLLIALLPVALVLVSSEILWRKGIIKGERARKFIHILAGIWIAFWPFYLPFDGIFILGCVALTFLIYTRSTKLFGAIYAVKRRTYGEIFYALTIIICSYNGVEPWIFTTSLLLLALADGGAAVVGRIYGMKNEYLVFGSKNLTKSISGTVAFVILAYITIFIGALVGGDEVISSNLSYTLVLLPIASTIFENISPYGSDNLITPVFATLLLNSLL